MENREMTLVEFEKSNGFEGIKRLRDLLEDTSRIEELEAPIYMWDGLGKWS